MQKENVKKQEYNLCSLPVYKKEHMFYNISITCDTNIKKGEKICQKDLKK